MEQMADIAGVELLFIPPLFHLGVPDKNGSPAIPEGPHSLWSSFYRFPSSCTRGIKPVVE